MRDRPSNSAPVVRVELKRADAAQLVRQDPVLSKSDLVLALGARADSALAQGIVRRYADRAVVFQTGEEGDSLFMVLSGEVRLFARKDLDSVELGTVTKGGVLGESEVLSASRIRDASALALGEADLVEVPRTALLVAGALSPVLQGTLTRVHQRRRETLDEMTDFLNRW